MRRLNDRLTRAQWKRLRALASAHAGDGWRLAGLLVGADCTEHDAGVQWYVTCRYVTGRGGRRHVYFRGASLAAACDAAHLGLTPLVTIRGGK